MSNRINLLVRQCTVNHCNTQCQKIVALTQNFMENKNERGIEYEKN